NDSVIYNQYNAVGNQFTQGAIPAGSTTFVPFPGNKIPTNLLDASALKTLKYIAPAGAYYLNSNGLISNVYSPRRLSQEEKRYTIRIDEVISDKDRLNVRYT